MRGWLVTTKPPIEPFISGHKERQQDSLSKRPLHAIATVAPRNICSQWLPSINTSGCSISKRRFERDRNGTIFVPTSLIWTFFRKGLTPSTRAVSLPLALQLNIFICQRTDSYRYTHVKLAAVNVLVQFSCTLSLLWKDTQFSKLLAVQKELLWTEIKWNSLLSTKETRVPKKWPWKSVPLYTLCFSTITTRKTKGTKEWSQKISISSLLLLEKQNRQSKHLSLT